MGREIRRVPMGWEHPRNRRGEYQPIHNETFKQALANHIKELQEWMTNVDKFDIEDMSPPDPAYYRPEWPQDAIMGYCVYEAVSEGTPTSPVFATKEEIANWLINQGYSEKAAQEFIKHEFSFSGVIVNGQYMDGIEGNEYLYDTPDSGEPLTGE